MTRKHTAADLPTDPHEGHGGSYTVDPETGQRTLVERTGWTANPLEDGDTRQASDVKE